MRENTYACRMLLLIIVIMHLMVFITISSTVVSHVG